MAEYGMCIVVFLNILFKYLNLDIKYLQFRCGTTCNVIITCGTEYVCNFASYYYITLCTETVVESDQINALKRE